MIISAAFRVCGIIVSGRRLAPGSLSVYVVLRWKSQVLSQAMSISSAKPAAVRFCVSAFVSQGLWSSGCG